MKRLHPLAITALKELHLSSSSYYNNHNNDNDNDNDRTTTTMIKAIFAETNTIDAADEEGVSTAEIMNRHRALYALGYRKLNYPYSQPRKLFAFLIVFPRFNNTNRPFFILDSSFYCCFF